MFCFGWLCAYSMGFRIRVRIVPVALFNSKAPRRVPTLNNSTRQSLWRYLCFDEMNLKTFSNIPSFSDFLFIYRYNYLRILHLQFLQNFRKFWFYWRHLHTKKQNQNWTKMSFKQNKTKKYRKIMIKKKWWGRSDLTAIPPNNAYPP